MFRREFWKRNSFLNPQGVGHNFLIKHFEQNGLGYPRAANKETQQELTFIFIFRICSLWNIGTVCSTFFTMNKWFYILFYTTKQSFIKPKDLPAESVVQEAVPASYWDWGYTSIQFPTLTSLFWPFQHRGPSRLVLALRRFALMMWLFLRECTRRGRLQQPSSTS